MDQSKMTEKLTPEQEDILKNKGTEAPFSGKYYHLDKDGMYICAACGNPLFDSRTKFDSGSGWPSFFDQASKSAIREQSDDSHGMHRIEVVCAKCGGHLGHRFDDGPKPTGKRFCINSLALNFQDRDKK